VIEIDKGVGRPDFFPQLVAGDDLAGILQQRREDLKGLFLEPDASAVFAQLSGSQVNFKNAKAQKPGFAVGGRHRHDGAPVVYTANKSLVVSRQSSAFALNRLLTTND
jgi:hypothetical protein